MNTTELTSFLKQLISDATILKNKYTDLVDIKVNYACVFAHDEIEYKQLNGTASQMGKIIKETEMGYLFHIDPFTTKAGKLQLIKIRKPDPTKTQRGYVDFTVPDYPIFKSKYLSLPNFKLTQRDDYEMIGLADATFDVLVYFAYPPMDKQLGLS